MKTKLILFEGIPGSGKSTLAHKSTLILNRHARENNYKKPILHREGGYHPANLEGCFIIPDDKTDELLKQFPKFEQEIRNTMIKSNGYLLVQRLKDFKAGSKISKYLQENSIGAVSFELFEKLNHIRWSAFTTALLKQNQTAIFDCAFLQDQITDLMLWHEKSESDIIEHIKNLEETILELNPFLFYLQQKNFRRKL
jgi:hypothetical protein